MVLFITRRHIQIQYRSTMLSRLLRSNRVWFCQAYLSKISRLYEQKNYEAILGTEGQQLSLKQLREKFYTLVKKYHSDNMHNDQEKRKQYEEITKIIVTAFRNIQQRTQTFSPVTEDYSVEDQICRELFGKTYREARYWMYEKGNEHHRKAYFDRLGKNPGQRPSEQAPQAQYVYQSSLRRNSKQPESKSSVVMLAVAGILGFAGLLFVTSEAKATQPLTDRKQTRKYDINDIERIKQRDDAERELKKNAMVNLIVKDHPPSVKYPDEDPHVMKQLTQFSIAPDIHLYEVQPQYYQGQLKQETIRKGFDKSQAFQITRIKPNTTLTLSLEAERALQNVYVRVKDVIKQIKTSGKFTPPQVFIKFHGYIMFEIREKPMTLANYKDTDYISLFDLYFEHYSPIWLKKDRFCHYLMGKDEEEYFGWVHLNTKKCNPVYLNYGDKVAYFHMERESNWYKVIWNNYYRQYHQNWAENHKKPTGSIY